MLLRYQFSPTVFTTKLLSLVVTSPAENVRKPKCQRPLEKCNIDTTLLENALSVPVKSLNVYTFDPAVITLGIPLTEILAQFLKDFSRIFIIALKLQRIGNNSNNQVEGTGWILCGRDVQVSTVQLLMWVQEVCKGQCGKAAGRNAVM